MRRHLLALTALAALFMMGAPLGAAPSHAPKPTVDADVRSVLTDARYRFCHEDDYPLTPEEHAWCPLVGDISGACPSLPKACKLPAVPLRPSFAGWGRGRRGKRSDSAPVDRTPDEDARKRPLPSFSLPDMSGFARVLFFLLIAVALAAVVRAIVRNLMRDRAGDEGAGDAPPDPAASGETAPPAPRGPIETDVERLLARARAAAERGDYARAVDDAYAALLRRLDGDGLIEIHPSRTNGDYVRSLGDRPDLKGPVGAVVREVEGVQFGATAPSESVFRSVIERVIPLVSRALVLALVFFGLSIALSCTPHDGDDGGAADTSPSGTQAIVEVLTKQGLKVRHRGEALTVPDRPLALVILPGVVIDTATWKGLLEWVKDKGGTLILGGAQSLPHEIGLRSEPDTETAGDVRAEWSPKVEIGIPPGHRLVDEEGNPPSDDEDRVQRWDDAPRVTGSVVAVHRIVGEGKVIVFADERYLSNVSLTVRANAQFLVNLLQLPTASTEVEICDEWTGAGAQTPLDSVQNARLTPVVLQLFVLLLLLFLWKGRAFARLRDPPAEARRTFADHARALGLAYGRAHASRHVTGLYAVWALERLRERVHSAGRTGLIPLAEAIAARTGRPEGEVMSVLVEASSAREEAAPPSSFRVGGKRDRGRRGKDAAEADLALMHALMSYLAATGQRRPIVPQTPGGRPSAP